MKEFCKSLAIVFLSCSAVYLASQVEAFTKFAHYLLVEDAVTVQEISSTASQQSGGVVPWKMVAVREGTEGVEQLALSNTEEGFFLSSQLLKEALGNMDSVAEVAQEDYFQAVATGPSLYFQWAGEMPLSLLERWLSGDETGEKEGLASGILLTEYQGNLGFFYEEEGRFYACTVSAIELSRLEELVAELEGTAQRFAFQEEGLEGLDPFTLISQETLSPLVYRASTPFNEGEERLLEILGFQASSNSQYSSYDGLVVRSGTESLRLSYDGEVSYQKEEQSPYLLSHSEAEISLSEQVEGCWQFATEMLSTLDTVPQLHFSSVTESDTGHRVIRFSGTLAGIPLSYGEGMTVAEFEVLGEEIISFSLYYRNYIPTEKQSPVLPVAQALAILGEAPWDLMLVYQDDGTEVMSATWVTS